MTKSAFLAATQTLYRVANLSDDSDQRADWTKPAMAGSACCQHLDRMLADMVACGAIDYDDVRLFHDTL